MHDYVYMLKEEEVTANMGEKNHAGSLLSVLPGTALN